MNQKHSGGTAQKQKGRNGKSNLLAKGGLRNNVSVRDSIRATQGKKTDVKNLLNEIPTKMFTTDTNVLVAFKEAMLCFDEHDVFVTWQSLLELDKLKRGSRKENMLARRVIDLMYELVAATSLTSIHKGIPLVKPGQKPQKNKKVGKLFFNVPNEQDFLSGNFTSAYHPDLVMLREHIKNRNSQLQSKVKAKKIIKGEPHRTNKSFVFISKDKMARLMALLLGVPAQDFLRDAFDENRVLSEQVHYFPNAFWENQKEVLKQKDEEGREQKQIRVFVARAFRNILVNEFVVIRGSATSPDKHFRVIDKKSPEVVHLRELVDYMKPKNALLGIRALNHGQNRALDVLLDPDVRVVILHGSFGTSKTFMALLAGYYQMIQHNAYRKILVTRVPVGIGRKKLEAIPGGVNEKMSPYMQGVKSNTHILASYFTQSIFPQAFKKEPPPIEILKQRITSKKNKVKKEEKEKNFEACYNVVFGWMNEVRSVEHPSTILGMSFFDEFVLYEEVQDNITEEFKSFLTRLGKGDMFGDARPKIVLTGSLQQMGEEIDDGNSAFARLIAKSVGQKGLAQVLLTECTRDPLVHVFNEIL